jgi:hypothetical protein
LSFTNPVLQWLADNHALTITKISRRELRGCQTTTAEDVEQHVWLILSQKALKADGTGTDFRLWDRFGISDLIIKVAREFVARERIEFMHFAGAFIYTPGIVEVYLKDAVWANLEDVVDIDGRVDVKEIILTLPLGTQRELFVHYGMDQPHDHKSAAYKRVERAVETISDRLNMGSGVKIGDMADAA